jgi:hypothetical protein
VDWIERLTGLDPDGGNGTLELLIMLLPTLAVLAWSVRGRAHRVLKRGPERDG